MKHVQVYCDGGCRPNPGKGAGAALLIFRDIEKEFTVVRKRSTNNRMELEAAILALKKLKTSCSVDLYTDSQYLQRGMTKWIFRWRAKGWHKVKIKNKDLWIKLDQLSRKHKITWNWIPGHAGIPANLRVDALVQKKLKKDY